MKRRNFRKGPYIKVGRLYKWGKELDSPESEARFFGRIYKNDDGWGYHAVDQFGMTWFLSGKGCYLVKEH